jgi:mannose-6-phosphate isomerase
VPIARLHGTIADYAWGSPGAISRLLGWPESAQNEAEWWLGTHPLGMSTVESGESLSQYLASVGEPAELPYLFKVLSPTTPLSLQVHPSAVEAAEGFQREEAAGIPLDAPTRLFNDPHAKPELVVAMGGPFHALAGIRPIETTLGQLEGLMGEGDYPSIRGWIEKLSSWSVEEVIGWLLSDSPEVPVLLDELGRVADRDDTLSRLHRHYPTDPGIAVGMMMHRLTLLPGEAAFLEAGQLHAYLEGYAIELMAPSDNVLRGGLTPKHVDVEALLEIAVCEPVDVPRLEPQLSPTGGVTYAPDGHPLRLGLLEGTEVAAALPIQGSVVVIATDGEWSVECGDEVLSLERGQACVVPGQGMQRRLTGSGQIWWAFAD